MAHESNPEDSEDEVATAWDARATYDLGLLIRRYLSWHPPPEGSSYGAEYHLWASEMRELGEQELGDLGLRPFRSV